MTDILVDLDAKYLPQIQGYNGEYTDEDFVLETFKTAAEEIRYLRALNDKAARSLSVAFSALHAMAISGHGGSHIASKALEQMGKIADE